MNDPSANCTYGFELSVDRHCVVPVHERLDEKRRGAVACGSQRMPVSTRKFTRR